MHITEPEIKDVIGRGKHPSRWVGSFKMTYDGSPMEIDMEIGAPTKERLEEKLKHLKETGVILRG